ncbi:MAG: hypothetical protein IPP71_18775 [Bacteroidetes bacterium]|nr:hypothetical protein [Bacteroidota bacterium]
MKESHLPIEFLNRLRSQLGDDFADFIAEHSNPAPVSVRINPFKKTALFDSHEKVPWATNAYYLPDRISFTHDPLFHAGCYYVQEASSMFLEKALTIAFADGKPLKILDLCAAPGGKSTHIASCMPEGSLLVANEVISNRNIVLQQNIVKWGLANVVITQNETTDFSRLEGFFDVIVIDAPCSGEGLFRKDPAAVDHWSVDNVAMCASRQKAILNEIYPSLKQGGYLIYSTCTYEEKENEEQVLRLMQEYAMEAVTIADATNSSLAKKSGTQFYPHRVKGEGFFIAMLRKIEDGHQVAITKSKAKVAKEVSGFLESYLEDPSIFLPLVKNNELYALPSTIYDEINLLMNNLFVRKAGIHVGTIKGKDLVPSHELALSVALKKDIPRMEFTREDAIRYLKCESINAAGMNNGWVVITFKNISLGWIKVIGSRTNNYFPRSQRILKP